MIALFFDTETNGIKTWQDPDFQLRVVQLGAILQDTETKRILAEINLIARREDGYHIPEGASRVHGITDEMAAKYGVGLDLIDYAFSELMRMADVLVAHNLDYDTDVIRDSLPESLQQLGEKHSEFCTMEANLMIVKAPLSDKQKAYFSSKGKKPDRPYKVPGLAETYRHYFGTMFEGAHDAMADIRACRDIYFAMSEEDRNNGRRDL